MKKRLSKRILEKFELFFLCFLGLPMALSIILFFIISPFYNIQKIAIIFFALFLGIPLWIFYLITLPIMAFEAIKDRDIKEFLGYLIFLSFYWYATFFIIKEIIY